MATQQLIPVRGKQTAESEKEELIGRLKGATGATRLHIESNGETVGVYTMQDGALLYQSGPKIVRGGKAHKYMTADIQSGRTISEVGVEEAEQLH